jgi:hypothetical protein
MHCMTREAFTSNMKTKSVVLPGSSTPPSQSMALMTVQPDASSTEGSHEVVQEKPNSKTKSLPRHLIGYFQETTVHGFRYVVVGTTFAERVSWVAAILLAFAFSAYLALTAMQEAQENPIVTSIGVKQLKEVGKKLKLILFKGKAQCMLVNSFLPYHYAYLFMSLNIFNIFFVLLIIRCRSQQSQLFLGDETDLPRSTDLSGKCSTRSC